MIRCTLNDVLLNWACAECVSPRWAFKYDGALPDESFDTIRNARHIPANLSETDKEALLERLKKHRVALLEKYVNPTTNYSIISLTADEIGDLKVLYEMHWQKRDIPLKEYALQKFDPASARDPRRVAEEICVESGLSFRGMPIVVKAQGDEKFTLIEGYSRCIAILKKGLAGGRQDVFVCE